MPAEIAVDFGTGISDLEVQADLVPLCEILLKAKIMTPDDWSDSLEATITAALNRVANETLLCGSIRALNHLKLVWTTDIDNGIEAPSPDGPTDWRANFSPDLEEGKPIGAFALRVTCGFERVSLEPWGKRICRELNESAAADCVGVLDDLLYLIGGWTPGYIADNLAEQDWTDYDEADESFDYPLTHENFTKAVPQWARSRSCNIGRLEKAVEKANRENLSCRSLLEASFLCFRRLEAIEKQIRLTGPDAYFRRLSHLRMTYYQGAPPVAVFWKDGDDPALDPCHRFYDDEGEMMMCENWGDLCWMHGWDIEKPGDGDEPGTLAHALSALLLILSILPPLDALIQIWNSPVPAHRKNKARPLIEILGGRTPEAAAPPAGLSTPELLENICKL